MPVLLFHSEQVSARVPERLSGQPGRLPEQGKEPRPRKEGLVPSLFVPRLRSGEVHLWTITPANQAETGEWARLLSPAEVDRAGRFRFSELSERYVSDHARLRLLLAAYLDIQPGSIFYAENPHGKPRLDGIPDCRLRFNLSHTDGLTMMAFCLDAELGVDVERLRRVEDRDAIAAMYFSPAENRALLAQPEAERDHAFLRCWTRKEAYLKARGEGLSLPLDKFTVSLAADEEAALLRCEWEAEEVRRWKLEHLQPASGYLGALAIEAGSWSLQQFCWPSERAGQAGD